MNTDQKRGRISTQQTQLFSASSRAHTAWNDSRVTLRIANSPTRSRETFLQKSLQCLQPSCRSAGQTVHLPLRDPVREHVHPDAPSGWPGRKPRRAVAWLGPILIMANP